MTNQDTETAEIVALADEAARMVIEDRSAAFEEGRDPLTIWELFGQEPRALAVAEHRLEMALARLGVRGEA